MKALWPVQDSLGVTYEGTCLAFMTNTDDVSRISISLLLRGHRIYGVDLVPASECKPNGPMAQALNLPPRVCGSHLHTWNDNRAHVNSDQ